MDFLASLNIPTLPEQQTRTSNKKIAEVLSENPEIELGFDACCNCGSSLSDTPTITCKRCKRVNYCSNSCRTEDAHPSIDSVEEDDTIRGHGPIVCSLLGLCNMDEDVEEEKGPDSMVTSSTSEKYSPEDRNNAEYRVQSELESYPATLANLLMDGPCFQTAINRKFRKKKRSLNGGSAMSAEESLTVHIIGSSRDAELFGDKISVSSYGEALAELAERNAIPVIRLVFVGPDCDGGMTKTHSWTSSAEKKHRINFYAHSCVYDQKFLDREGAEMKADIVVFFNPGFTCADYRWEEALDCVASQTPFFVTTNTEMEAIMDCQYLLDGEFIPCLPKMVEEIVQVEAEDGDTKMDARTESNDDHDHGDLEEDMFFGENPFCGSRVRQSGTMANDLFVKNRWMFGGIFGTKEDCDANKSAVGGEKVLTDRLKEGDDRKESASEKFNVGVKGNSKKVNPALI